MQDLNKEMLSFNIETQS